MSKNNRFVCAFVCLSEGVKEQQVCVFVVCFPYLGQLLGFMIEFMVGFMVEYMVRFVWLPII